MNVNNTDQKLIEKRLRQNKLKRISQGRKRRIEREIKAGHEKNNWYKPWEKR